MPLHETVISVQQNEAARTKTRVSGLFVTLALVVSTWCSCVAMLEIGLRVLGRYHTQGIAGYFAPRGLSYGLKKSSTKTVYWPSAIFTVHTCELGYRAERPGGRHLGDKPYYAVLGSSEVFGNGLNYEDTFIGLLAAKLKSHNVDVVNLAVGGHQFMEQEALFREFASFVKRPPDVVVIGLNPLFIGGYDDTNKDVVVRIGELLPKDDWRLAMTKLLLANFSATYVFFRDALRNLQAEVFPKKDFPLAFYVERYSTKHPIRTPDKTQDFLRRFKEFGRYVRSLNATPVCTYFPTVGGFTLNEMKAKGRLDNIEPFDTDFFVGLARTACESEGYQFINTEPLLQEMYDAGQILNFRGDAHFNFPTNRAIGDYLYHSLSAARALGHK
jgi:hypothetical protein